MSNLSVVERVKSEHTIACLEELLERAKQGQICGLVYLAVLPLPVVSVESRWVGRLSRASEGDELVRFSSMILMMAAVTFKRCACPYWLTNSTKDNGRSSSSFFRSP